MISEGNVKIFCGNQTNFKGPGTKKYGFYNPTWKIDREIQVLFCKYAYNKGARKFLDGMAATGIRGIRIKKEIGDDIEMHINDSNKKSFEIIKKNVELNGEDAVITNKKFCRIMAEEKYDYIDLDPYGSPAIYIPCIFEGVGKKAFISISATDVATLSGVFKRTCMRRYGAISCKYHGGKEIGLRILLGYVAKVAATFGYSFEPQISYSYSHYFRIYGYIERSVHQADKCVEKIGWFHWDDGWKAKDFKTPPSKKLCGPLWLGKLHSSEIIKSFEAKTEKIKRLFKKFYQENEVNIPYYESWRIAKELKKKQPSIATIIEKLKDRNWQAVPTHFDGNAFKTDAPYQEIKKLF